MSSSPKPSYAGAAKAMTLNTELRAQAHRERSRQKEKSAAVPNKPIKTTSTSSNSEWSLIGGTASSSNDSCTGAAKTSRHANTSGDEGQGRGSGALIAHEGGATNTQSSSADVVPKVRTGSRRLSGTTAAVPSAAQPLRNQARLLHSRRRSSNSMGGMASAGAAPPINGRRVTTMQPRETSIEAPKIVIPLRGSGSSAASIPPSTSSYRKCAPECGQTWRTSASSNASEVQASAGANVLKQADQQIATQSGSKSPQADPKQPSASHQNGSSTNEHSDQPLPQRTSQDSLIQSAAPRKASNASLNPFSPLLDGIMSRLESPPKMDERIDNYSQFSHSAILIKSYYEVVEKCRNWQRYGNALRSKAETLEVEADFARNALKQRDTDIRDLEAQNEALRRTVLVLEGELHRLRDSQHGDTRFAAPSDHGVALRHYSSASVITSPPNSAHATLGYETAAPSTLSPQPILTTRRSHTNMPPQIPSSHDHVLDIRAPTPLLDILPATSWQQMVSQHGHNGGTFSNHVAMQENMPVSGASSDLVCETQHEHQGRSDRHELPRQRSEFGDRRQASYERPQLTSAALAAINKQSEGHVAFPQQGMHCEPSITAAGWATAGHDRAMSQRVADARMEPCTKAIQHSSSVDLSAPRTTHSERRRISLSMVEAQAQAQALAAASASQSALTLPWDASQVNRAARCDSGHSDALTVTEEYLQGIVGHKRRLRKISQNQQQQLQYLQARTQRNSSASRSSHGSSGDLAKGVSRPASRLSSHGASRGRGRNNSVSVHETIPIRKDDVFSKSTERIPLKSIDANSVRPSSALGLRDVGEPAHSGNDSQAGHGTSPQDERTVIEHVQVTQSPQHETTLSPTESDSDPKGAHRRLYLRLRNELTTPDIVRFERYVHRYDALEIGIEGSRGIVNRVRRLLLPEDVVKAKSTQPERYRFRKDLAREFERIVREDAVPVDSSACTNASQSGNGGPHCSSEAETTYDEN